MTQETAVEISDEVVEVACIATHGKSAWSWFPDTYRNKLRKDARITLQAAIPLVVEGLIGPELVARNDTPGVMFPFMDGSNARRKDILAKVKK
jgi:hypothetical protein